MPLVPTCTRFAAAAIIAFCTPAAFADDAATQETGIAEIASRWSGEFNNHRHIAHNAEWGGPRSPELSTEKREMRVVSLDIPAIGDTVLFLEEYRATVPGRAHRQRVISLVWDEQHQQVRAQQYFFRDGPGYDRQPLAPAAVAGMGRDAFMRVPTCDLFFSYDADYDRYRGAMQRQACTYQHETSGMVYAEFEMLLYPTQQWYRDRSIRLATNTIRGQVDGFSYLRFDKLEN